MEMWTEIRRKVLVEGVSKRSILRDYKVSAGVLEKILTHAEPPGYRQSVPRPKPQLGQFIPVIEQILKDDKTAPPKQRHTAKRIFERLRDEYDYTGCSSQVRAAVARVKRNNLEVFVGRLLPQRLPTRVHRDLPGRARRRLRILRRRPGANLL